MSSTSSSSGIDSTSLVGLRVANHHADHADGRLHAPISSTPGEIAKGVVLVRAAFNAARRQSFISSAPAARPDAIIPDSLVGQSPPPRRRRLGYERRMNVEQLDVGQARTVVTLMQAEIERLNERLVELTRKIAELRGEESSKQLEIELIKLREQRAILQRQLFGVSSEKRSRSKSDEDEDEKKKKHPGHGPRQQPELPVVEQVHELDGACLTCSLCGGAIHEWENQFEESEEITVQRRTFSIIKHRRKKGRCTECYAKVITAPGPPKLIRGGRYSIQFAVDVAVEKYTDHIPLNRQVSILERDGLVIDSQTLWDQIDALAKHVEPTYDALRSYVLSKPVINADETPWYLFREKPRKKWYMWCVTGEDVAYYWIEPTRSTEAAKKVLGNYEGTVIADGYKAYSALIENNGAHYRLAYCWAHSRRKYRDVEQFYPDECEEILTLIGKLYDVERGVPDPFTLGGDAQQRAFATRKKLRNEVSRGIVTQIHQWALEQSAVKESGLGNAIKYMLDHWLGLQIFLEDPMVPIDNNRVERQLRGPVVGRKNHYGSRSRRGTEVAAIFYSLLGTAKLAGIDARAYLDHVALESIKNPGTSCMPREFLATMRRDGAADQHRPSSTSPDRRGGASETST